jgi:hypothetical protein
MKFHGVLLVIFEEQNANIETVYFVDKNIISSLIKLCYLVSDVPLFILERLSKQDLLPLTQTFGGS